MKISKYSLPRHTILAKQGPRIGAFLIDAAFMFALFLGLLFAAFRPIFSKSTNELRGKLSTYEVHSALKIVNEEKQTVDFFDVTSLETYTPLEESIRYYYLNYLTGTDINPDLRAAPNAEELQSFDGQNEKMLPKDYYTIEWYNQAVLGITNDSDSETSACYFTYVKDGEGNPIKNVLGVAREKRYDSDLGEYAAITKAQFISFFDVQYRSALSNLYNQSFYEKPADKLSILTAVEFGVPFVLAGAITYIIIPLFFKYSETLGKKLMKIGLTNMQGYKYNKAQLLLRFIPFLLTTALSFIVSGTFYVVIIIVGVMFLGSFGVAMASPKHSALHDYTGQSIVVSVEESIIFNDYIEEEAFLAKEDGVVEEEVAYGEEPELKYEK